MIAKTNACPRAGKPVGHEIKRESTSRKKDLAKHEKQEFTWSNKSLMVFQPARKGLEKVHVKYKS